MTKILFIGIHRPFRSPSQRFRFDQFMPFFIANNCQITYSSLITETDDVWFYSPGHTFKKTCLLIKAFFKRLNDLRRADSYDVIFVQREAIMIGTSYFERQFAKKTNLIYDFDDSIWLLDMSVANKKFGWLKKPQKTADIIRNSCMVLAGNQFLADYARPYNPKVKIVPTSLMPVASDFDYASKPDNEKIVIGWIGSTTTIKHIEWALPILKACAIALIDKVKFVVVSDKMPALGDFNYEFRVWSTDVEYQLLTSMDIGIMPLPDNDWTRGKCGFKGLQCMSYGIPTVMSAVGVNNDIIETGVNGFLADQTAIWVDAISKLVNDKDLRIKIGENGKNTIETKYSATYWQSEILQIFKQLEAKR